MTTKLMMPAAPGCRSSRTPGRTGSPGVELVPGHHRHDDDQRTDVEDQDAVDDAVDRVRQRLLRIRGLAGGNADQFDALVGERHDLQPEHHPEHAGREETAVRPKIGEARRLAGLAEPEQDDDETDGDHRDDRHHLDDREPELDLAEDTHGDQVRQVEHAQRDQGRDPLRHIGKPVIDVDADGGDLRHARDHPHEPVRPAGEEAGPGADELLGIGGEGTGDRPVQQELTQRPHDEEDRDVPRGHRPAPGPARPPGYGGAEPRNSPTPIAPPMAII